MPFLVKKLTQVDTSSQDAIGKSLVNLAKYTEDEFFQVSAALQDTYADHVWNKVPPRPRRGTYAYADGTNWNPGAGEGPYWFDGTLWHRMGQGAIATVKKQIFTASGTYTPSAGLLFAILEAAGAGGGGGGVAGTALYALGAGGGAAGGYSRTIASAAAIGVSLAVTIGALGAGGAVGFNSGTAGGATSIGALCIANGGGGGARTNSATYGGGGTGATAGTGDIAAPGGGGGYPVYLSLASSGVAAICPGGSGANSMFGAGGNAGANGTGFPATGYGAGGGGASANTAANFAGGNGAPGLAFITEFCNQ